MKKKVQAPARCDVVFPVGSDVKILRPSMWFGATGIVESESNGLHTVRILARDKEVYPKGFTAVVAGTSLEVEI